MKKIILILLYSVLIHANNCPKWLPLAVADITAVIPIYDSSITEPDMDCDGIIDRLDSDIDGDGVLNSVELNNGTNVYNPDTDGDGVDDASDAFPLDPNESSDSDGDGVGDNADTPQAYSQTLTFTVNSENNIIVLQGKDDNGTLTYTITSKPKHGELIGSAPNLKYNPNVNFIGKDSFAFRVNDGELNSKEAIVTLNIVAPTATIYEDAESGDTEKWFVSDNDPSGATISNVYENGNRVIKFEGDGLQNSYAMKYAWNNATQKNARWDMNFSGSFSIFFLLETQKGMRTLYYDNSRRNDAYLSYIQYGLGSYDGWRTIHRDLEADLREFEPDNSIVKIHGFYVRGSGYIDNIMLHNDAAPDNHKPKLTLVGDEKVTVELGKDYVDPGATAYDSNDGDITNEIIVQSNVDTSKEGLYTVTYNVTDKAGNKAEEVTRKVEVLNGLMGSTLLGYYGRETFERVIVSEKNNAAYSTSYYGLYITDISNPSKPILRHKEAGNCRIALSKDENRLYVSFDPFLAVFDVSDPFNPKEISRLEHKGDFVGPIILSPDENFAYVSNIDNGIDIVDISNPNNLKTVGKIENIETITSMTISNDGNTLYITSGRLIYRGTYFHVYDVSHPSSPRELKKIKDESFAAVENTILTKDNDTLYVAGNTEMFVMDVSTPSNAKIIARLNNIGGERIFLTKDKKYILRPYTSYKPESYGGYVKIIDVSQVNDPQYINQCRVGSDPYDLYASEDTKKLYVINYRGEFKIFDLNKWCSEYLEN